MYDLHDHDETRYTDEATGGQKGAKLTQLGALDPVSLIALSRVAGYGAAKYAAFNFLKGYDWALSFNAMQRHALLFWSGEDIDAESGQPHVAMAAWHAMTLTSFLLRGVGTDTRPPGLTSESPAQVVVKPMTETDFRTTWPEGGGVVLAGPPAHADLCTRTESTWDPHCSACSAAAEWIRAYSR